ncbi:MAG: hypothetical protein WAQ25_00515 [Candidatus Saccharimonas sp.]
MANPDHSPRNPDSQPRPRSQFRRFRAELALLAAVAGGLSACGPSDGAPDKSGPVATATSTPETSSNIAAQRKAAAEKLGIAELIEGFDGPRTDVIAKQLGVENKPDLVKMIDVMTPEALDKIKGTEALTELFRIPVSAIRPGHEAEDIAALLGVLDTMLGNALNSPALIKKHNLLNLNADELTAYVEKNYTNPAQTGLIGYPVSPKTSGIGSTAWRQMAYMTAESTNNVLPGDKVPLYYIFTLDASNATTTLGSKTIVIKNVKSHQMDNYSPIVGSGKSPEGSRAPIKRERVVTIILSKDPYGKNYTVSVETDRIVHDSHADNAPITR